MNTELDELISKMKKLFDDSVYMQENYDGSTRIHNDLFFEEVKLLLIKSVTIRSKV